MTLPPPPLPPSVIDQVRKTLLAMKKASGEGAGAERFKVAAQTMLKYIGNIAASPEEEKYRYVCTTAAVQGLGQAALKYLSSPGNIAASPNAGEKWPVVRPGLVHSICSCPVLVPYIGGQVLDDVADLRGSRPP